MKLFGHKKKIEGSKSKITPDEFCKEYEPYSPEYLACLRGAMYGEYAAPMFSDFGVNKAWEWVERHCMDAYKTDEKLFNICIESAEVFFEQGLRKYKEYKNIEK